MSDRFILKQFAGNATNDDVHGTGIFGSCSAGSPTLTTDFKQVQSLQAYEDGWSAATLTNDKLPPANEMQGLQGLLCKAIKEIYSEGIPEWIDGETYYLNSFVQYNGIVYRNITGTSTSTAPDSDTTNWQNEFARLNANNVFTNSQTIMTTDNTNAIRFIDTALATNNTTPTNTAARVLNFTANDISTIANVTLQSNKAGFSRATIGTQRTIGGTNYDSYVSCTVYNDGTISANAPTPASTSKSSEIATTAWVSDLLKGGSGWVYLGNSIGLCYGHEGAVTSSGKQITLPHAFDSTTYNAIAVWDGWNATTGSNIYTGTYNHTTTKMTLYTNSTGGMPVSWIAIGQMTIATKP